MYVCTVSLAGGSKKGKNRIPENPFFRCVFWRIFSPASSGIGIVVGGSGRQNGDNGRGGNIGSGCLVAVSAAAQQQHRCHCGSGGGRRSGRGGNRGGYRGSCGNSSGSSNTGSGGNKGSSDNKGSRGNRGSRGIRGSGGNSSGMSINSNRYGR